MTQGFAQNFLQYLAPSFLSAKGDLLSQDGANLGRLPVGSNDQKLLADSAETLGIKWAGYSGARVYKSGTQSISNASETTILFDLEQFDTDSYHSTSSNTGRLTVSKDGLYIVGYVLELAANATGVRYSRLFKNGATNLGIDAWPSATTTINCYLSLTALDDGVATDYYTCTIWQNSGGALNIVSAAFWIARIF